MVVIEVVDGLLILVGIVVEVLIVVGCCNVGEEIVVLIEGFGFEVVFVMEVLVCRIFEVYVCWGKGVYFVGFNYGDCFVYEVVSECGCLLLFVGDDFL